MKLASDTEPVQDENKTDEAEINTIEPSNPILSSVQEDPIKPVTPVTFPESGTESEVSKSNLHVFSLHSIEILNACLFY